MVSRARQRGVTYLWLLFLVFVLSIGLGKSLDIYSVTLKREKERELLYIGNIYKQAIRGYYLGSPGGQRRYPGRLEELLLDKRYLTPKRYLRRLYSDPVTGKPFNVLMAPEGGIHGVASTSSLAPLKTSNFPEEFVAFGTAKTYQDWMFVYGGN